MNGLAERIECLLDEVSDPCSVAIGRPAGLVTMGLIKSLEINQGEAGVRVALTLRLTSPCCMMGPHFAARAVAKLKQLPEVVAVEVGISPEMDWDPAHMRAGYRMSLPRPSFMRPE
jgi:metal-sulfur cluster biosynthetic enzyme